MKRGVYAANRGMSEGLGEAIRREKLTTVRAPRNKRPNRSLFYAALCTAPCPKSIRHPSMRTIPHKARTACRETRAIKPILFDIAILFRLSL